MTRILRRNYKEAAGRWQDWHGLHEVKRMDRQATFEEIASQNVVEEQVRELKNLKGKLGTLFGRAVERKFNYPLPH